MADTAALLKRREGLTGVRGAAVLIVLAHYIWAQGIEGGGFIGVEIFFVLTGVSSRPCS